jgi:hypothetical protein
LGGPTPSVVQPHPFWGRGPKTTRDRGGAGAPKQHETEVARAGIEPATRGFSGEVGEPPFADDRENKADCESRCPEIDPLKPLAARLLPVSPPSDEELERAIVDAMLDGRGAVAELLAERLKESRRARAGVVMLAPKGRAR